MISRQQTGIVTGAASGIGLAVAQKLLNKGINLALFDLQPIDLSLFSNFS